jgi:non-heme chloroperoxidase
MAKLLVGNENGTPVELHYEDHGAGPPVVLIHGWPLSSRSWEGQVPALIEKGYRVIVYDRRGFGNSSQPWFGYDYDTMAADLNVLLEQRDVRDATLVGFSMGGGEVARYVGAYGTGRVSKAVFASAVPPYLYKTEANPNGAIDDAAIEMFQSGVSNDRVAFVDEFVTNFFSARGRADLVSDAQHTYNRDIAAFASPKGTLDCVEAFSRTDFRADLAKFNIPTLVIHGDSDAIVPFEASGKRTHDVVPGSKLVLVENAPHGLNVTHRDQFNQALLDFLAA